MNHNLVLPAVHSTLRAAHEQISNAIKSVELIVGAAEAQAGPWFLHWNGNYWDITVGKEPYSGSIAAVWATSGFKDSSAATAQLMVAAPRLLSALRDLLADDEALRDRQRPEYQERLAAARSAIAEAESRS